MSEKTKIITPEEKFEPEELNPEHKPVAELESPNIDMQEQIARWAREYDDGNRHNSQEQLEDQKFLLGGENQWNPNALKARKENKLPVLTINKLPQFVNQVTGKESKMRLSIHVRPSNQEATEEIAKVYAGMIRFIQQNSLTKRALSIGRGHAAKIGEGFWRVKIEDDMNDVFRQELKISSLYNTFRVFYDPTSNEPDFSDARYVGVIGSLPRNEFVARYPDVEPTSVDTEVYLKGTLSPRELEYSEIEDEDEIYFFECYWREYKTYEFAKLTNGVTLDVTDTSDEELAEYLKKISLELWTSKEFNLTDDDIMNALSSGDLKYIEVVERKKKSRQTLKMALSTKTDWMYGPIDWPGNLFPIIRCIGTEEFVEGLRYKKGVIRDAKDPQRSINYVESQAIASYALAPKAPWLIADGLIGRFRKMWQNANTGNFQTLIYKWKHGWPTPRRESPPPLDSAALSLAQNATNNLRETTGIYDASLGQKSNETSGRAIGMRQDQSETGFTEYIDNYEMALEMTGKVLVDLFPEVYSIDEVVNILDLDMKTFSRADLRSYLGDPDDPIEITRGKYTVVVEAGASFATERQYLQEFVVEIMRAAPPEVAIVLTPLIAKYSDVPGAEKIEEELAPIIESMKLKMGAGAEEIVQQAQADAVDKTLTVLVEGGALSEEAAVAFKLEVAQLMAASQAGQPTEPPV